MPKKIQILIHILCSALFLSLCFLASPDWPRVDRMLSNPHGLSDFVFQTELIFFFYFNYFFLLPRLYFRKKHFLYFTSVLFLFALFVPLTNGLIGNFFTHGPAPVHKGPPPPGGGKFVFAFMSTRIYTFLLVFVLSFLLKILSQLREIKNQNVLSELELLKAQINPHFFFNTLNTIYSLSVENSPKTPETILKLSSMMRYVLRGTKSNHIGLDKELAYIGDYIDMQMLRLDPRITVNFTSPAEVPELSIAPMILIPFIENVFKHGIPDQGDAGIEINISLYEKKLRLHTINRISTNDDSAEKTQIGQTNSNRRLELLYPGKHILTIRKNGERYEVLLEITLDNK